MFFSLKLEDIQMRVSEKCQGVHNTFKSDKLQARIELIQGNVR